MENLLVAGGLIAIPVFFVMFRGESSPDHPKSDTGPRQEITAERFEARLRQERLFSTMTSQEKALFTRGYTYEPPTVLPDSDPFVRFTNICSTLLLMLLLYLLFPYLAKNKTYSLKDFL